MGIENGCMEWRNEWMDMNGFGLPKELIYGSYMNQCACSSHFHIYLLHSGQKIITEQYGQLHLDRIGCLSYEQSSRSVVMTLCELPLKGPSSNQVCN